MHTAQHFNEMVQTVTQRMQDSSTQAARTLITQGQPFDLACYYKGGPVVTRVAVPDSWRKLEAWRNRATVDAILPEHQLLEPHWRLQ